MKKDIDIKKQYLEQLPLPPITSNNQCIVSQITRLVDEILHRKQTHGCSADTTDLEAQIDQLVYKLYNLTPEEIELIEKNVS